MVTIQKYLKYKGNTHLENGRGRDLKKKNELNDSCTPLYSYNCILPDMIYPILGRPVIYCFGSRGSVKSIIIFIFALEGFCGQFLISH